MSDSILLLVGMILAGLVAAALITLVWKMRDLATRQEVRSDLDQTTRRLDADIKRTREESNRDINRLHERLDEVIQPLGEISGTLKSLSKQVEKIQPSNQ
ncbi:hypothetical protein AAFN60_01970 [Roseibacillus persicicus]|uniref:hypothetical protein n=1 Tax=Roseibacillus persicicus TaxID=454148 RepID=UPI00398B4F76